MKPHEFWQNFKLGAEQEIAANFIYDAIRNLHEMETLNMETEIFPVLYNLSIGIERLMKVVIVLIEYQDGMDINAIEESLITHNHMELYKRIKPFFKSPLGNNHIQLLNLLTVFYKTHRYDRFNLSKVSPTEKDKEMFYGFLNKYLDLNLETKDEIFAIENTPQIKRFIGRTVKKITKNLYALVNEYAQVKNLYTYEISGSGSKAAKVLWGDDTLDFEDSDRIKIESLIFLMGLNDTGLIKFIKAIQPLDLDPAMDTDHLQNLLKNNPYRISQIQDEIECLYEGVEDRKDRIEKIDFIRDPGIYFSESDEIEQENDPTERP